MFVATSDSMSFMFRNFFSKLSSAVDAGQHFLEEFCCCLSRPSTQYFGLAFLGDLLIGAEQLFLLVPDGCQHCIFFGVKLNLCKFGEV